MHIYQAVGYQINIKMNQPPAVGRVEIQVDRMDDYMVNLRIATSLIDIAKQVIP